MNLTMDLTAQHANYAESNRVFRIFKYGQYVDFETPIHKGSLKIYLISGGITDRELVYGEDYTVPDSFISSCDNDMSSAKMVDPSFDGELISGIQMLFGVEEGTYYTIAASYQRLYPNQLRTQYHHNQPLELTPELLYDVIKSVEQLKVITSRVSDVTSLTTDESILLEMDAAKINSNNYIADEAHLLNVPNGRFMIHPKGGAFYFDSLVVKHPATNEVLKLNKDYFIVGMNEGKTKLTSHTSPVYDFILIVSPIVDTVEISYHAFGGDPTLDNYRSILKNMNNIVQYLNDAKTITEDNLGTTNILTSLYERLDNVEAKLRRLEGTPAYGDITDGKCIIMKLFADTPGLHWYTIASLYTVAGQDMTPCIADTFIFRLQSQISHFQFQAAVSVDLSNNEGDRFNVNVISENYPRGYIPFKDYSGIEKIIRPQLRVVWTEGDSISGAYLQLGFELTGMLEETISIEDMSGHESCWKLIDEVATVTTPLDDNFQLPSGALWASLLDTSRQETMLVPFNKGHLVWAGLHPLNYPTDGWQYFEVENHMLPAGTNIKKFTRLRLDIEEHAGLQFPVDILFNSGIDHLKGHATFTHQDKPAYVNAEIYYIEDALNPTAPKKVGIRLNYDITAGIESNQLHLRDLVVFL